MGEKKLNKKIVNTVDEELKKIFGKAATLVIYGYLEDNLLLRREKIPEKIELFFQGLDKFFGSGAYVLKRTILMHLYSSFGFSYKEKRDYTSVDYVTELENRLPTDEQRIFKN